MEFFKLRWKIFLSMALVIGGLLATVQFVSNSRLDAKSEEEIRDELLRSRKVFDGQLKLRTMNLSSQLRSLAESVAFKTALDGTFRIRELSRSLGLKSKRASFWICFR